MTAGTQREYYKNTPRGYFEAVAGRSEGRMRFNVELHTVDVVILVCIVLLMIVAVKIIIGFFHED